MRIRASCGGRFKGGLHNDNGVGNLALKADNDRDREFMTSVYRIIYGNPDKESMNKGVAWMREYLKSFPPFGIKAKDGQAVLKEKG
jgi:hypothetical protein